MEPLWTASDGILTDWMVLLMPKQHTHTHSWLCLSGQFFSMVNTGQAGSSTGLGTATARLFTD